MSTPKISVVMSVYSDDEFLPAAIDSILSQSYTDFEFIIVNDNPGNEALRGILRKYRDRDGRIVIVENERNLGLGASLNRGLNAASGEYIARMDSDDISLPARLEKQLNFMEENEETVLLGTAAERIDEHGVKYGRMSLPAAHSVLSEMLRYTTAAYHPTWMFRRSVLDKLGGYRPFPVAQDYDFLWRLTDLGYKISNLQEPLFLYRISTGNASVKKFYQQWKVRKYILKLHEQRVRTGDDCFSEEALAGVLRISPAVRKLSEVSQTFFEKSVIAKREGRRAGFIVNLLISVIVFPQKLEVLYSTFKSKRIQADIEEDNSDC